MLPTVLIGGIRSPRAGSTAAASAWLNKNHVELSTSRPSQAPRKAFQAVGADDVRQLMDSGVAKYL